MITMNNTHDVKVVRYCLDCGARTKLKLHQTANSTRNEENY